MRDEDKTKEQLVFELEGLRRRLAEARGVEGESRRAGGVAAGERRAISRRFRGRADRPCVGRPGRPHPSRQPAFLRMLGYSESEIVALGLEGFTHPDDWKRDYPVHFAALARRNLALSGGETLPSQGRPGIVGDN